MSVGAEGDHQEAEGWEWESCLHLGRGRAVREVANLDNLGDVSERSSQCSWAGSVLVMPRLGLEGPDGPGRDTDCAGRWQKARLKIHIYAGL